MPGGLAGIAASPSLDSFPHTSALIYGCAKQDSGVSGCWQSGVIWGGTGSAARPALAMSPPGPVIPAAPGPDKVLVALGEPPARVWGDGEKSLWQWHSLDSQSKPPGAGTGAQGTWQ